MADFKTHVTTSTVLGVGYAGAGMALGAHIETSLVAGGLCGVSGMLPDLDSDSGVPIRESMAFAAAVVPMFLLHRFQHIELTYDMIILVGGVTYLFIRFVIAELLKRYTVHRGMFHSIPAAIIFAEIGFLLCASDDVHMRYYKAGGVLLGVLSHLLLDELYSIEWHRGRLRLKKSSGTAFKLWGRSLWGNVSTYVKLILLTALIFGESSIMQKLNPNIMPEKFQQAATELWEKVRR